MNVSTKKKIIDLENRLVAARGGEGGSGRDRELGVNGFKLLLLEWICNEILLCSIENLSRYLHRNTTVGGKSMYTCMCNLVPMLYSGKKKPQKQRVLGDHQTLVADLY